MFERLKKVDASDGHRGIGIKFSDLSEEALDSILMPMTRLGESHQLAEASPELFDFASGKHLYPVLSKASRNVDWDLYPSIVRMESPAFVWT